MDHEYTGLEFEQEVRNIARLLWPSAVYGGAAIEDGQERDGIFETEEVIHIIECTVSRKKEKAEHDYGKLKKLYQKFSSRQKNIKGWFITLHEPTVDQRKVFDNNQTIKIVIISFDQFVSKLFDANTYLSLRKKYSVEFI